MTKLIPMSNNWVGYSGTFLEFDKQLVPKEHIYFDKINPDCFEINLKSELLEYTGHEQIVTFDYFGQQVLGKFASTLDIEINKELRLNIDTSQISLFDKDSKKRI